MLMLQKITSTAFLSYIFLNNALYASDFFGLVLSSFANLEPANSQPLLDGGPIVRCVRKQAPSQKVKSGFGCYALGAHIFSSGNKQRS